MTVPQGDQCRPDRGDHRDRRAERFWKAIRLFDIYEGAQIKPGYKSVAYSVTFRAKDRTLEDKDVSAIMDKIMKALSDLGAELRA